MGALPGSCGSGVHWRPRRELTPWSTPRSSPGDAPSATKHVSKSTGIAAGPTLTHPARTGGCAAWKSKARVTYHSWAFIVPLTADRLITYFWCFLKSVTFYFLNYTKSEWLQLTQCAAQPTYSDVSPPRLLQRVSSRTCCTGCVTSGPTEKRSSAGSSWRPSGSSVRRRRTPSSPGRSACCRDRPGTGSTPCGR